MTDMCPPLGGHLIISKTLPIKANDMSRTICFTGFDNKNYSITSSSAIIEKGSFL